MQAALDAGEVAVVASAVLALTFALANPRVASVLFGATTPAQVTANAEALTVGARLDPDARAALH